MAVSIRKVYDVSVGNLRGAVLELVNDATATAYPSGGFPVSPQNAGISTVVVAELPPVHAGYGVRWDYSTNRIRLFKYDYPAGSAGAAIELTTGTDTNPANSVLRFMLLGW